jgi:flagellar hook-length control protein FliK
MNVTIGGHGQPRAEVRFTHRNGTIEMAVRTPDPEVAQSLRAALPELGSTLDSQGFRSEIRADSQSQTGSSHRATPQSGDHESGSGDRGRPNEWNQHNQERRQRRQFEMEDYD